jgi:Rps23 Pro-64 3,4-dihydroxylase Tpa1-like proline 4-hydroxylase
VTWRVGAPGAEPSVVQVTLVAPKFNRLTVFDGRYPHGVRAVEGTRDPLRARVVLHGWFTEPAPFFDGGALCILTLAFIPGFQ